MSYDNTLKYLVEQFPYDFAKWLANATPDEELEILKTELSKEPIRADGLVFLRIANRILHLEFQTSPDSDPPLPFRMLDYWVRLYRQYQCEIIQVVIFLKETTSEKVFVDEFKVQNTIHRYRVVRIWEMNPSLFMDIPGLLPLVALTRSDRPESLLAQVAQKIDRIEERAMQSNVSACVQLLAGIKFDKNLIRAYFREELLMESVIYQSLKEDIERKAKEETRLETKEEDRIRQASLFVRMLQLRLGNLTPDLENSIKNLSFLQLEELLILSINWNSQEDLVNWLSNLK